MKHLRVHHSETADAVSSVCLSQKTEDTPNKKIVKHNRELAEDCYLRLGRRRLLTAPQQLSEARLLSDSC